MTRCILASIVSFLALQWLSIAEASHFRHGIITWAPVDFSHMVKLLRRRISLPVTYTCNQLDYFDRGIYIIPLPNQTISVTTQA